MSTIMKEIQNSLDFFTHASNFQLLIKNHEKAGKKNYPKKEGQERVRKERTRRERCLKISTQGKR